MTQHSLRQADSLLNLPIELRNVTSVRLARSVTYILSAAILILIAWAAVAPVEETAVASGRIEPAAAVSDVYHLEGGIVEMVLVKEGTQVRRGQILMNLRPQQAASDLAQLDVRITNLRIKRERLTASLTGREPDFELIGQGYPKLKDEHRKAFEKEREQAREEARQLDLAVQRFGEQVRSAQEEARSLATQVEFQQAQVDIRTKSNAMGYTSKHTLLQAQGTLEQTRQRLVAAKGRIAELGKMLEEAKTKLRETVAERLHKLAEERSGVTAELTETEETREKYRDRFERLQVVSPIDGVVQSLVHHVEGEVIKPGEVVAQIVPGAGGVVAAIELRPSDIGHVRVGNSAEIKLSNYDPNVVGILRGQVELISPTTFENKDGQPFYRVRIALDRQSLNVPDGELPITPGTTLNAQIRTGSKTLLRYLLKPVYQSLDTVFAER